MVSKKGTGLSASRIRQTHQLMGAVLKYANKSGMVAKNVASEIDRRHDLPESVERPKHFLTHAQLLGLAARMGRFGSTGLSLIPPDLRPIPTSQIEPAREGSDTPPF